MACKCKCTLVALALGWCGWAILLAGQAALHAACNKDEIPALVRKELFDAAGIPSHASTAHTLGWSWMVVFFQFGALLLATAALTCTKAAPLKLGVLAVLAVSTVYQMTTGNVYLQLVYNLPSGIVAGVLPAPLTSAAVKGVLAGTIIESVLNLILCMVLGWSASATVCALTTTDCQKPETKACPATATASGRTEVTADAASAAFLTKIATAAAVNNV